MTVTVNSLGANSAEIIVTNENTAIPAANAVETFLIARGWTRVAGVGNNYERIYSAANLTTGTKFIKINALDMHIEHAESYSGTTTVTATNPAFRHVNNDHLDYARDLYGDSLSSVSSITIVAQVGSSVSTTNMTIAIPAGQTETLYPGQFVRVISRSTSSFWIDGIVVSHNNITGDVVIRRYGLGPANTSSSISDWSILTHRVNYSTGTPSYIYISASARHVAIQIKHRDGVWADWHAVMETENPAGAELPSILTTGFMISNSGYVNNVQGYSAAWGGSLNTLFANAPSLTSSFGSFRLWCGPYSQPRSRLNRAGVTTSRFSKISTPLGDAGPVGSQRRFNHGNNQSNGAQIYFLENIVYFKGMADVIPNTVEAITGQQWAFSGVAVTDLTETATWIDLSINTWPGYVANRANNSISSPGTTSHLYEWASVREQSSWRPHVPTLLGRIYGIKFVTSGLPAGNILSVKVDPNGFADNSGIAQDHLVMNYQSRFVADSRQNTTSITPDGSPLNSVDQAVIRQSQSASVAFPK